MTGDDQNLASHETEAAQAPALAQPAAPASEAADEVAQEEAVEAGVAARRAAVWHTNKDNPDLGPEWGVADPTQIDQTHTE